MIPLYLIQFANAPVGYLNFRCKIQIRLMGKMSMPGSPFHGLLGARQQIANQMTLSESALGADNNGIQDNLQINCSNSKTPSNGYPSSIAIKENCNSNHEYNNISDIKVIPAKRRIISFDERRTNSLPHHYKARPSSLRNRVGSPEIVAVERDKEQKAQVNPVEFKKRLDIITDWFVDFNDEQRTATIQKLLPYLGSSQFHYLSHQLPDGNLHALCNLGCSDFLPHLPEQITAKILIYLDPVSLVNASLVCKDWHNLVESSWTCWKRLCFLPQWQLSGQANSEQLEKYSVNKAAGYGDEIDVDFAKVWKTIFVERFKLRRAWLKGRCHVRTFEGHSGGISCVQFDGSRIVSGSHDKTIRVWNIKTNSKWSVLTLAGHSGEVRCLHLESGGNRLVSGSTDATIKGKEK